MFLHIGLSSANATIEMLIVKYSSFLFLNKLLYSSGLISSLFSLDSIALNLKKSKTEKNNIGLTYQSMIVSNLWNCHSCDYVKSKHVVLMKAHIHTIATATHSHSQQRVLINLIDFDFGCEFKMGKPQRRRKVHFGDTHLQRRWRTRSRKRDLDQVQ